MGVQITIRNVPEAVRDELASRAALRRQSMQEYLRAALESMAGRPAREVVMERARRRAEASDSTVTSADVVRMLEEDRNERGR